MIEKNDLINEKPKVDISDCPLCGGPAILEEEGNWCTYVTCLDCGCHTAEVSFSTQEERVLAAEKAAHLWNIGKVLSCNPGE